ncbi:MAG: hypothetical protein R6U27_10960 [Desulfobacterales bacterium]
MRNLPPAQKIIPVCMDLPLSKMGDDINRDQWMAMSISKIFSENPDARVFIKVGNLHILRYLDWQDHISNGRKSIREELVKLLPNTRVFSLANVIDEDPDKCDFTKEFSPVLDTVAIDCDDRFSGWKAGFLSVIAIKPAEICDLVDGFIIY